MLSHLRRWSRTIRTRVTAANAGVIAMLGMVAVIATLQFGDLANTVDTMSDETEAMMRVSHALENRDELLAAVRRIAAGDATASARLGVLLDDTRGHVDRARDAMAAGVSRQHLDAAARSLDEARASLAGLAGAEDREVAVMLLEEQIGDAATALAKGKLTAANTVDERLSTIGRDVHQPVKTFWWVAGLTASVAMFVLVYVRRRVLAPIERLRAGVKQVEAGEVAKLELAGDDELTELASAFNGMARAIADREASLQAALRQVRLILDNTEDGMLVAGFDGRIEPGAVSTAVVRWFGPVGDAPAWQYICGSGPESASMRLGFEQLRDGFLPLEILVDQLPRRIDVGERSYDMAYVPIETEGVTERLLIVARDITEQLARTAAEQRHAETQHALAAILRSRSDFARFVREAESLIHDAGQAPSPTERARALHTLKGNSLIYGLTSIATRCHALEDRAAETGEMMSASDAAALKEAWQDLRNRIEAVLPIDGERMIELPASEHRWLMDGVVAASLPRPELSRIRSWADTPAERLVEPLAVGARRLAERLDRDVDVVVSTAGIRVDAERTASLWSALSHAVRNAIDHGIEPREVRAATHKRAIARLELSVSRQPGSWSITIDDDGAGIDWDHLARKAAELDWPRRDHAGLIELVFRDGVSTREHASDTSGRGVGLAALKAAADQLGATVVISSERGRGTRLTVTVPEPSGSRQIPIIPASALVATAG
jgi:two-component sensor histidine kinase/HAMP domain-containing protein/HPt (histidine-containing phosphotransfer) domain-containing protein